MKKNKPAIEWDHVVFGFDKEPILQESSFSIEQGTYVGIMGPNGGGKTTLLKLLMGFLKPWQGSIQIFDQSPLQARPRIGYVPQFLRSDRDFPITTEEVIQLGCLTKPEKKQDAELWIERLGLLPHRNKPFGTLSGGLGQKTLIARALISDPDLLFLDEVTANIDPPSALAILDLLQSLKGKKTILLVTHDIKTIVERVDQILCVQGAINTYLPGQVCEHFAMGLYHTPLLELPPNHWK
ncbi:MAG: ATP-binding cassette domain-containing protein [Verrucomicrobiota bacterium]|nr:ATP-binding cassette domain-containing protein [Verrucomicrobiota bacterium]